MNKSIVRNSFLLWQQGFHNNKEYALKAQSTIFGIFGIQPAPEVRYVHTFFGVLYRSDGRAEPINIAPVQRTGFSRLK